MPKEVLTARAFVERAQAKDAKFISILRVDDDTAKFKLKTTKKLFTLTVKKSDVIEQVISALPENLKVDIVDKKKAVDPYFQEDENEQNAENQE